MKRIWLATMAVSAMALVACGMSTSDDAGAFGSPQDAGKASSSSGGGYSNAGAPSSSSSSSGGSGGLEAEEPADGAEANGETPGAQSGLLTAGVWDDNLNFDFFKGYLTNAGQLQGLPSFSLAERETARTKWAQRTAANELDIAFLIDTTGSMGDELKYLQTEIQGISETIKTKFPQVTPRYGLVLYRDKGDAYETRPFDFQALDGFRTKLAEQSVGGGGDYPEGVAAGLDATLKLSWRNGAVARLAFWVADAPHHIGEEGAVKTAITTAMQKDVHVYPVAASGTDDRAEYTMRTAAQLTGGRYVFLTDDSGVGNDHAEPHIPCYHVTRFDGALVRMVESELSGTHAQPKTEEIIRSVGNPQNGQCSTKSSGTVKIY